MKKAEPINSASGIYFHTCSTSLGRPDPFRHLYFLPHHNRTQGEVDITAAYILAYLFLGLLFLDVFDCLIDFLAGLLHRAFFCAAR
jgi:hypothetical protein